MLIAGARKDQILAPGITPSAKRSIVSRAALDSWLVNTTPARPTPLVLSQHVPSWLLTARIVQHYRSLPDELSVSFVHLPVFHNEYDIA